MVAYMETFCINCGGERQYTVKSNRRELTIRGIKFSFVEHIAYCTDCNEEVYVPEINDENVQAKEDAYREAAHLITVTELNDILEKYNIGAGPLSVIMDFGEITINRYMRGQLPSKDHSDRLKEVLLSHKKMEEYLEKHKNDITSLAYGKCRKEIDKLNDVYTDNKIDVVTHYLLHCNLDITHLALQKMLYYAQAFFHAIFHIDLFTDDCEAWVYGPVYPYIYDKYKGNDKYSLIECTEEDFGYASNHLTMNEITFLNAISSAFGKYSGSVLIKMTHNERPWQNTRGCLRPKDHCRTVISKEEINTYFDEIVNQYKIVNPCDIVRYSEEMYTMTRQ